MEPIQRQKIIRLIQSLWENGEFLEAGVLLYERIPRDLRPRWGAKLLEVISHSTYSNPAIEDVIRFAQLPEIWASGSDEKRQEAHNFFSSVRQVTLRNQKNERNSLTESVLILAENIAKVTYNAYGYKAPFDHDTGWWIAVTTKSILDNVSEPGFTSMVWPVFICEEYIELDEPVRCNPYCGMCYWLKAFEI